MKNKKGGKEKPMKKVCKGLLISSVLWLGAAALAGWKLQQKIGDDAMAIGIIASADGPTSIVVNKKGKLRGWTYGFFHSSLFFANLFSPIKILAKREQMKRYIGRKRKRL